MSSAQSKRLFKRAEKKIPGGVKARFLLWGENPGDQKLEGEILNRLRYPDFVQWKRGPNCRAA